MNRPPPKFLPGVNSKKWHGRKHSDSIGFLRVQHLSGRGEPLIWTTYCGT